MNPQRKFSIQTDYIAGIIGPASFAEETQSSFHKLIGHARPKGWDRQFPTTFFFNIGLSAKRFIASPLPSSELILNGEINIGSMTSGFSLGSIFRIGRMLPYFNSYVEQYVTPREKRWQLYVFLKPQASVVIHNALLEGTLQGCEPVSLYENEPPPQVSIRHIVFSGDLGLLCSFRAVAFSLTYKETSSLILNQPCKALGNISIYMNL